MAPLELAAAALLLANVALVVARSVWNYPFGLAGVLLYAAVFWEARLYSDALLQVFFVAVQVYGWRAWLASPLGDGGGVAVRALDVSGRAAALAASALLSGALGLAMSRFTDAASPWWDAAIAGTSIVAQALLALRYVETWPLWIAVDVAGVALFWSRGLALTAGLYAVFLLMACAGAARWWRALPGDGRRSA